MLSINPVSFTANPNKKTRVSKEKKEEIRDGVVAGGAAGAGYSAVKSNSLKMLQETEAACKAGKAAAAAKAAEAAKAAKEGAGLFSGLKNNAKALTKKFVTKLDNIKTSKYIKPIINNRFTRLGCGIVGGFLAGCILVSGIGTLYNNTTKIVDEYAPRVANRVNRIADRLEKDNKKDE